MQIQRRNKKKIYILVAIFLAIAVITCGVIAVLVSHKSSAPKVHITASKQKTANKQASPQPALNKSQYSTVDPNSIWVVVNKPHSLNPTSFQPSDLTSVGGQQVSTKIAPSLNALIAAAKAEGVSLRVVSGFRSYSYQTNLYNSYVASDGQAAADTYSARPGHSEHQTGLAVDIGGAHGCDVQQCFGSTPEGKWLSEHVGQYGFIIRYTEPKQTITGYQAEPWHIRYVGVDLVNEMKKQNITTLEEFFDITGGTTYNN
jgi:zinc D-Ala-D-Ala carboxypeptidase